MYEEKYYVNLNLQSQSILNYKQHPLSQNEINNLTSSLDNNSIGLSIYDITNKIPKWWDGDKFKSYPSSSNPTYSLEELNDLSSKVTWSIVPNQYISSSSIKQYESDLVISESQIIFSSSFIEKLEDDTSPILGNNLNANSHSITNINDIEIKGHSYGGGEIDNGNSTIEDTINWTNGNFQESTLTNNCTFTFITPAGPTTLILKLIQDATGSRTVTFPTTVKWSGGTAPTLTTTPNSEDLISFYFDGTNYYGGILLNMQ